MPFIETQDIQKGESVKIFYQDYGEGQPVILIHGWPLSYSMWEQQIVALVEAGYRCIAYDRRGFGVSSQPWGKYDYTTLAQDLNSLITNLNLNDCVLVGFSMGGGEVVRYLTEFGSDKVAKAALISSIIPLVPQKPDNPDGVPKEMLDEIMQNLQTDRAGFLEGFTKNFFNYEDHQDKISEAMLRQSWSLAMMATRRATLEAAKAWAETDFRPELKNVTVPTLIVHGKADQVVPIATSSDQAAKGISDNRYEVIEDAPHGLYATHTQKLNQLLIDFLKE